MQDEIYMARALKLAARGRFTTHPNPNVGCVIVKDGQIVGEGFHYRAPVNRTRSARAAHGGRKSERRDGVRHAGAL
ncbi:diaminohydroxyphosphoribosylaminopyrimidine deaminase [Klebsiella michiganensis]|uniref:Diaminohydroxyphosphoribosylaminopyrimidine deaminase n=1 Tax=Klebsiella michiganensis TaxID=1134687 RepID=A0A7H4N686_9ENTR|nr:diaminohydroxyphosphoribosylaminopyrimidine deaminase [Klebsiella michiganensis]